MTYEDAVNLILMHGIGREDVPLADALLPDGFLACLRPYLPRRRFTVGLNLNGLPTLLDLPDARLGSEKKPGTFVKYLTNG